MYWTRMSTIKSWDFSSNNFAIWRLFLIFSLSPTSACPINHPGMHKPAVPHFEYHHTCVLTTLIHEKTCDVRCPSSSLTAIDDPRGQSRWASCNRCSSGLADPSSTRRRRSTTFIDEWKQFDIAGKYGNNGNNHTKAAEDGLSWADEGHHHIQVSILELLISKADLQFSYTFGLSSHTRVTSSKLTLFRLDVHRAIGSKDPSYTKPAT